MGLSLLLGEQIITLFLMGVIGFIIVKIGILKAENSEVLSKLCVYVFSPCVIVNSFQITYTKSKMAGLGISFLTALAVQLVFIAAVAVFSKVYRLQQVEKASLIYTNCGYLIVPLVAGVLGEEWVFYATAYLIVFQIMVWTHGIALICKGQEVSLKKIITNPNIIACIIGLFLFITQIRLPFIAGECIAGFSKMVGPASMLIIGMLIGNINLQAAFKKSRIYIICAMRLVVLPLIVIGLMKLSGAVGFHPDGREIMCIILFAASAPAAAAVTQIAQVYGQDAKYAGLINAVSVIFCIITMPVMVLIYEHVI